MCFGSPAWDVVGLLEDARERHGEAFGTELLAAYGRDVDPALTEIVRDAQVLYGTLGRRYCGRSPAPKAEPDTAHSRIQGA